jgi:hypothetical protein
MAKKNLNNLLNENFRTALPEAFKKTFGEEVVTVYNFFDDRLQTKKVDETDFTKEQLDFICAYEAGYSNAKNLVWEATNK